MASSPLFLLVAVCVAGGGLDSRSILLTAIAGIGRGCHCHVCAGEFVATKSQNKVMQGEINFGTDPSHSLS
jgi:hypothetical protein